MLDVSGSLLTLRYPSELFAELFDIVLDVDLALAQVLPLDINAVRGDFLDAFGLLADQLLLSHPLIFQFAAVRSVFPGWELDLRTLSALVGFLSWGLLILLIDLLQVIFQGLLKATFPWLAREDTGR